MTTAEERKLSATAERFCRRFSLAEIQLATQDFSEAHLVGKGGFGKVYKGQIDNGQQTVAMKRLAPNSNQGEGEFLTEIETLSMLRHINLVSLIGYCNEKGEMILVYEYIARGTLADHLYKLSRSSSESEDYSSLTWKQRLSICIGAGRGIDYLHTGTSIIHRDVKSTNILLDENFTAKVSDFGLAKHLSTSSSKSHVTTAVKGSFGYLDPSYFSTWRLTRKSDTYAFGVVLLEVLCGRPAVDARLGEDEMSLVMWAQQKISKGKVAQIVASNLRDEISANCLKTFVGIAKRCVNHDPKKRPTMAHVVAQLEFALEQQGKKTTSFNASRFLPFLDWIIPSGSHPTGLTQNEFERAEVNIHPVAVPAITIDELKDITNNFSSQQRIGRFRGCVYQGALKSGQVAAIKINIGQPEAEFLAQVLMVSSLKHENVAQLLGYCVDGHRQILAYEFAPNGSLHDIFHGEQGAHVSKPVVALSWGQRVKIAMGAAQGLEYIHEKGLVHCNIKSSNILLFDDYQVAKIADFEYPRDYIHNDPDYYHPSALPEFRDYIHNDPDYYHPSALPEFRDHHLPEYDKCHGEISWRSDVYSFGLVLLELMTGGKIIVYNRPTHKIKKMDARLNGEHPPMAAEKMAAVAALCVEYRPYYRANMSTVVNALRPLLQECSDTEMPPHGIH